MINFCRGITNMAALVITIYARLDISRWILIIQKRIFVHENIGYERAGIGHWISWERGKEVWQKDHHAFGLGKC